MKTKLTIQKVTPRPFKGAEGKEINYFWYKAIRKQDQVNLDFGSPNEYNVGDEIEIILTKYEKIGGKIGYKESKSEEEE